MVHFFFFSFLSVSHQIVTGQYHLSSERLSGVVVLVGFQGKWSNGARKAS